MAATHALQTQFRPVVCLFLGLAVAGGTLCGEAAAQSARKAPATVSAPVGVPVIVELFTSEGCSSCPPADDLLAALSRAQPIQNVDILALEEHVTYWDQDGWHDRFDSDAYTQRQQDYEGALYVPEVYTPQMIVDGVAQFNGTDSAKARAAIEAAGQKPHVALTVATPALHGDKVQASVSLTGPLPAGMSKHTELFAALVQPSAVTQVASGENKDRTLHHANIVRTLSQIGNLEDLARGARSFSLSVPKDTNLAGFQVVVFAQQSGEGPILGAGSAAVSLP